MSTMSFIIPRSSWPASLSTLTPLPTTRRGRLAGRFHGIMVVTNHINVQLAQKSNNTPPPHHREEEGRWAIPLGPSAASKLNNPPPSHGETGEFLGIPMTWHRSMQNHSQTVCEILKIGSLAFTIKGAGGNQGNCVELSIVN